MESQYTFKNKDWSIPEFVLSEGIDRLTKRTVPKIVLNKKVCKNLKEFNKRFEESDEITKAYIIMYILDNMQDLGTLTNRLRPVLLANKDIMLKLTELPGEQGYSKIEEYEKMVNEEMVRLFA